MTNEDDRVGIASGRSERGMSVDIGEAGEAKEQPRFDAVQLRATLNVIPAYTWYATPSGGITFVNTRTADYLGLPKDHPLRFGIDVGAPWDAHISFVHPDEREQTQENWSIRLRTGEGGEGSFRVRNAQGGYRWFISRVEPLRAKDGTILQWVGMNLDIEEVKCAEQALRESEYKLRQMIDTVPGLVWSAGPDGDPTHVSQRLLDYSGMRLEDFQDRGWEALMHPDDLPETAEALYQAIQTGTSFEAVHRLRQSDGEYRWHRARGEPLRDQEGQILQWYGLSVDVDEAKKAEGRLRRSEAYLAEAQSLGRMGSAAYNDTTILYWSDETYRIFGFDPCGGLPSRSAAQQAIHPDDRELVNEKARRAVQEKRDYKVELRIVLPTGTIKHIEVNAHPKFSASGELVEVVSTLIDITERKRSEQALRESEYKLRQILETVPSLIWLADPRGEPTYVNQRILDYIGAPFEDFVGRGWEAFLHPDDGPETTKAFQQAIQTGTSHTIVHRLRRSDGAYRWHNTRSEPLRDRQGTIIQWYGVSVDVDEGKRAEDLLRRSEAHLAEAQRLSHIGSGVFTATAILDWSEEACRIWGFDPQQGVPSREAVLQRVHPEDVDRVNESHQRIVREKKIVPIEFRIVLPDGTVKHIESTNCPAFSASGELLEIVVTGIDVTDRKRGEQALRESEAKFRDYAETASDWFWEIGPDYKFTLLTENAFGSNPADRICTACWDRAVDLETEPEKWRLIQATLDARKPFRDFVYCTLDDNGSRMYVRASGKPVFDAGGEFRGYRGTGTDVTIVMRAQRAEASLRTVQAELAHVSRLTTLGQLTASISHEVRQPIASARNNARAALNFLDKKVPDLAEIREALACVVADADRAGQIVGRIRDQIKKAPPRNEFFDLNVAVNEVIALLQCEIANNRVSIQTRLADGQCSVQGDRVQLQQVVMNLVLNAIEAMSSVVGGPRELLISTEQNQADGVLVAVGDSGPGIEPEHLDRIFEAFYTTKSGGLGIGLSICRSIIDAHGGRLWAGAIEPAGTVFWFTLPSEETASMSSAPELHESEEPRARTASVASRRKASEGNRQPRLSRRGRGQRHSDSQ